MPTIIKTASAAIVTTAEAKAHMRVDWSTEDDLIDALVLQAQMTIEERTRRAFDGAVFTKYTTGRNIDLERSRFPTVDSVKYGDDEETLATLDAGSYFVSYKKAYPQIVIDDDIADSDLEFVVVEYTAGTDAAIAPMLKIAVLQLCGHWYENREATSPLDMRTVPANFEDQCGAFLGID